MLHYSRPQLKLSAVYVFTHSLSFGSFSLHASQYQRLSLCLRSFLLKCFFDFKCSSYIFNDVHRYFGQTLHVSFEQTSDYNKRKNPKITVYDKENQIYLKNFTYATFVGNTCSFCTVFLDKFSSDNFELAGLLSSVAAILEFLAKTSCKLCYNKQFYKSGNTVCFSTILFT